MWCPPLVLGASLGKGLQERLDPWSVEVVDAVHGGHRYSLGDGDRSSGHIRDFAFERVARLPPLKLWEYVRCGFGLKTVPSAFANYVCGSITRVKKK